MIERLSTLFGSWSASEWLGAMGCLIGLVGCVFSWLGWQAAKSVRDHYFFTCSGGMAFGGSAKACSDNNESRV